MEERRLLKMDKRGTIIPARSSGKDHARFRPAYSKSKSPSHKLMSPCFDLWSRKTKHLRLSGGGTIILGNGSWLRFWIQDSGETVSGRQIGTRMACNCENRNTRNVFLFPILCNNDISPFFSLLLGIEWHSLLFYFCMQLFGSEEKNNWLSLHFWQ